MEPSSSKKWWFYLGTLAIELVTGVFRLLLTIPLTMVLFIIVFWVLSKFGIEPFDVYRLNTDLEYSQRMMWLIIGVAAIIAYANIITSIFAYLGFGGGSLMTRFVLGAREPSTREHETIVQVLEQMVEGADFLVESYSKLYVIDSVLEFANLIGTTLYVSSAAFRGNNLQALIAHEYGHLDNGDGSLILALRRLVFPPFSLFIGGIRDFSTNRPAYRPTVKEFDAIQIFYSMVNNIIFFTLAFIGGGIGVWVMSWAWANYFRVRDYMADSFAAGLGYRDLLLSYLEANIYFDTSIPYMLGWRPAAELRIDALQHPSAYGLPVYDDVPAAAATEVFTPISDVEPVTEQTEEEPMEIFSDIDDEDSGSSNTVRNIVIVLIIVVVGYLLLNSETNPLEPMGETVESSESSRPERVSEMTCPDTSMEAAALFGGSTSHWKRLNANAWKYVSAPGAPIDNLNIPAEMKGDWWDNFETDSKIGPAKVGYASEATIWCNP